MAYPARAEPPIGRSKFFGPRDGASDQAEEKRAKAEWETALRESRLDEERRRNGGEGPSNGKK